MLSRILIADDEKLATVALKIFLSDQGYEVRTATSPDKTIREGLAFRPDLLLVDYLLGPGQRGTDVARTLLAQLPGLKVLIMTGLPSDRLDSTDDLGGYSVIRKPLDLDQVRRSVAELVGAPQ